MTRSEPRQPRSDVLPVVERLLLGALFLAAIVLLSFPAARATGGVLGWTPFWLLALPATSLLAVRLLARSRCAAGAATARALPAGRRRPAKAVAPRRSMPRPRAARLLAATVLR